MSDSIELAHDEQIVSTEAITCEGSTVALVAVTNHGRVFRQPWNASQDGLRGFGSSHQYIGWECVTPAMKIERPVPPGSF